MNKSEIAEPISHDEARKLLVNMGGTDNTYLRLCQYVEQQRAIAESQAPPELVHLDCSKCGYYFEGWIDPPKVCPNDGTKLELGDGEPSPPPCEHKELNSENGPAVCVECGEYPNDIGAKIAASYAAGLPTNARELAIPCGHKFGDLYTANGRIECKKCESGRAQEVSPEHNTAKFIGRNSP